MTPKRYSSVSKHRCGGWRLQRTGNP